MIYMSNKTKLIICGITGYAQIWLWTWYFFTYFNENAWWAIPMVITVFVCFYVNLVLVCLSAGNMLSEDNHTETNLLAAKER